MKKSQQRLLMLAGAALVITFAVTALLRVDVAFTEQLADAGVYATLGDVCIYASVLVLGMPWCVVVSAVGMALADLVIGSNSYIIGSLLIKAGMAYFLAAFCQQCDSWKRCFAVAGIAEGIMVVGFFIYDLLIARQVIVALQALPVNVVQGIVCGALGAVVLHYLPPVRPETLPRVRRRSNAPDEDIEDMWD